MVPSSSILQRIKTYWLCMQCCLLKRIGSRLSLYAHVCVTRNMQKIFASVPTHKYTLMRATRAIRRATTWPQPALPRLGGVRRNHGQGSRVCWKLSTRQIQSETWAQNQNNKAKQNGEQPRVRDDLDYITCLTVRRRCWLIKLSSKLGEKGFRTICSNDISCFIIVI